MRDDLKKFVKELYLKGKVDAQRYKDLGIAADQLMSCNNITEEYHLINELAAGSFPELQRFLTENRMRAAENLENLFMERIDEHLANNDLEKARLMMDMLQTVGI